MHIAGKISLVRFSHLTQHYELEGRKIVKKNI